jgi:hypothetical protein
MADATVHVTTFIEGVLIHGTAEPKALLVPCGHAPHLGLLMPPQSPWVPGFLPNALLQGLINEGWKIPYKVVDPSKLPVVFDERTSRLPTPWCLRLEGLEGQQRLYLTHLLRTKAPDDQLPPPPPGGMWVDDAAMAPLDLLPSVKKLVQVALAAVRVG